MFNQKEYKKQWQKDNAEHIKQYQRQWQKDNPEKAKEYFKQWRENNPEEAKRIYRRWQEKNLGYMKEWREKNPGYYDVEYHKNWYIKNREKICKKQNQYWKNKYKINLKFNLNCKIKGAIRQSIKGNKAGRHWENLVGYTLNNLIKHLKFTIPEGYCWQDILNGKLHIDHIIPIRAFIFNIPEDEEFKQCWSLYNLRLLPAIKNISKNDSITNPILLELLLRKEKPFQPALAI